MLKTKKALIFCVLINSIACIACNSDSLGKQFDNLYRTSPLLSLPIAYSESFLDSIKFIEVPETLFSIFDFNDYALYIAKLPEYKNVKIIIAKVDSRSGETVLFLYTFVNNRLMNKLYIYGEGDAEYNGSTAATSLTSFIIANNYDIRIKYSIIPPFESRDKEVNVERKTYIINEDGKFVKK